MVKTASLGFPRIGANRELKKAVESFWKNSSNQTDLQKSAQEIRHNNCLIILPCSAQFRIVLLKLLNLIWVKLSI
jgi:hypothetical protein